MGVGSGPEERRRIHVGRRPKTRSPFGPHNGGKPGTLRDSRGQSGTVENCL
jgi:hypothetical protein